MSAQPNFGSGSETSTSSPAHPFLPVRSVLDNPASSDSAGWRSKGIPPVLARYSPVYAKRLLPLEHQSALFRRGDSALVIAAWSVAKDSAMSAAVDAHELTAAMVLTRSEEEDAVVVRSESPQRTGTFMGADQFHFGSGTARLIPGEADAWTVRFEDFAVRNGPDLYVYLSPDPDGYAEGAVELGTLKADTGAFNYDLPAGMDPGMYQSVVIWCKQFAVQFAHATLSD